MDEQSVNDGVFESPMQAKEVLTLLLKYFSSGCSGDEGSTPNYLTDSIRINDVSFDQPLSVKALHAKAELVVNFPVDPDMDPEELSRQKMDCMVQFSSMLDQMKTKTLVEIYRSLKNKHLLSA